MKQNKTDRLQVGLRMWAMRLGVMAMLSGIGLEANAIVVFPVDGADMPLSPAPTLQTQEGIDHVRRSIEQLDTIRMRVEVPGLAQLTTADPSGQSAADAWRSALWIGRDTVRLTSSFFLSGFSIDTLGPVAPSTVDLQSRAPVTPVSPPPASGTLFVTTLLGMLGVATRGGTFVKKAPFLHTSDQREPSLARMGIIVLSPDRAFAEHIKERLRRVGYDVRVLTSVNELLTISDPASLALVLVDHRIRDWDVLRTDSLFRHVQLMAVVSLDTTYTEEHCLSDLERGIDGIHDLRDGYGLLVAKVGAYLRRTGVHRIHRGVYRVGAVELDDDTREVTIAGQPAHLSAKPLAILTALLQDPGKILTRKELSELLWGPNFAVCKHTLDVHVHALRRQLEHDPDRLCRLVTIKGVGFKLKLAASADRMTREEATRSQDRCPIRLHNQRRLRWANRHMRRERTTDPARRIEGNGGKTPSIRRYVTAPQQGVETPIEMETV